MATRNEAFPIENHPADSRVSLQGKDAPIQTLTNRMGTGGGNTPMVLILNDQGGRIMDWSQDTVATLRAQQHGHQPIITYGIDGYNATASRECHCTIGVNCGMSTGRGGVMIVGERSKIHS